MGSRPQIMRCVTIPDQVTDYLEDRLTLVDRVRVQLHLGKCMDCRIYMAQMRQTLAALQQVGKPALRPEIRDDLASRFRAFSASAKARK